MNAAAITIKDLSKKYRLFNSARDRLKEALHPFSKRYHREFWALKDVSFEAPQGQTIGILGRNGSGKSTLLQIIAGVMQPTGGVVKTRGRIAALLELGAGFNPEFTGRQNVIFQAQVIGMPRNEIDIRVPEIERFADIGEFFDQPVKIYSSGMFVRVAFAVATSIDPDILVIDEALAVGDARFQERCYARLREFKRAGKTIIFVSHSVDAITALCDRALILEEHRVYADGEPKDIVDKYLRLILSNANDRPMPKIAIAESNNSKTLSHQCEDHFFEAGDTRDQCHMRQFYNDKEVRFANGGATVVDYLITTSGTDSGPRIASGAEISLYIKILYERKVSAPVVGFELKSMSGITIMGINTFLARTYLSAALEGEMRLYRFDFRLPLNGGDYFVDLGVAENDGSPGGSVMELRRSIIHLAVLAPIGYQFMGLLDLSASLTETPLVDTDSKGLVRNGSC